MGIKHPFQYELSPERVEAGRRWLTLTLQNIDEETLSRLDVRLNSLDSYSISVYGTGQYVARLKPQGKTALAFQVSANATGGVYVTIDGWKGGDFFHWETPAIPVLVSQDAAELVSLFALSEPRAELGEPIECEATVRSIILSSGLEIEFWLETPGGALLSLAKMPVKTMQPEEIARYSVEIEPETEGIYILHAYLYDGRQRIDHATEYISISL